MTPAYPVIAVTFDFWNTLMWEPAGQLLARRSEECVRVAGHELGLRLDAHDFERAHEAAFAAYQSAWRRNEQFCVPEAVDVIIGELHLSPDRRMRERLIQAFSDAGDVTDVRPSDGVGECLETLSRRGVKLSIVCDIGLTPSPVVRRHLERASLLAYFDDWAFSDEVGTYKPSPAIFRYTLGRLGVDPRQAVHVGDRKRTDVAGAKAVGMTAVRYTGVYDDPVDEPEADLVIDHLSALPAALGLAGATHPR